MKLILVIRSMGCVFYELLRLKIMIKGNSQDEQVNLIMNLGIDSLGIEEYEQLFKGSVNISNDQI